MATASPPPAMAASSRSCFRLLLDFTKQKDLSRGRALHAHITKTGLTSNNFLTNSILNMYAKCGHLPEATLQFEKIEARDVVSWNCLITGYAQQGSQQGSSFVLHLLKRMLYDLVFPNPFTFAGVFTATAILSDILKGKEAHSLAIKTGNSSDVFVGSSFLNMYSKLGLVSDARRVFDRMPERNSVTWAAMISGYGVERRGSEAFELFKLIRKEGGGVNEFIYTSVLSDFAIPDFVEDGKQLHALVIKTGYCSFMAVGNALVTMYAKCVRLQDSLRVFHSPTDKNSITWSTIITRHAQNDNSEEALSLFSKMQSAGIMPSEFTFVGVLNACSNLMLLREGKQVHDFLLKLTGVC